MTKIILAFVGGLAVGLLLIWGWNTYQESPVSPATPQTTTPQNLEAQETANNDTPLATTDESSSASVEALPTTTAIRVENQSAGETVIVAQVTLPSDGWIVVHEEQNGFIGNALGAARKDAGTYTDTRIPLLRPTAAAARYWIVLYSDNSDRQFNLADDFPFRDDAANPITNSFVTL